MNITVSGERGRQVVLPRSHMGRESKSREFPVVIRPRPLLLRTWEDLVRKNPTFGRRIAMRPEQLRAVARAILRHDSHAFDRFGDEETLMRYLEARITR